jgi:hypothetical protein
MQTLSDFVLKKLPDYEVAKCYLSYCVDLQDSWHNFCPL